MKSDIFQDRKCVHVKLEKETHAALRSKLFHHGISMQEAFDEFARQVVAGRANGLNIIAAINKRHLLEALNCKPKIALRSRRHGDDRGFNELESESLYNLLSEQDDTSERGDDGGE